MATSLSRIVFYDIPRPGPSKTASPSTWKTRFALNFKGLSYTTVWVEYPDIEALCISIGAPPTGAKASGEPHYTLPVIHDRYTGAVVADSLAIARYLDEAFPSAPTLVPTGTSALHAAFEDAFESTMVRALIPAMIADNGSLLGARSADYWRRTREARYGQRLEEICPEGETRNKQWKIVQRAFTDIASWSRFEQDTFVMGDFISWADIVVAAWLTWTRRTTDGKKWEALLSWDGGKWEQLTKRFEKWELVDEGNLYSIN